MINYISYLLRHRTRERIFSYQWCKIWGKRIVNLQGLIRILYRIFRLSSKGAKIGCLSTVGKLELNGKAANLIMGKECVIGNRVHLALHDKIKLGNNVVISDGCVLLTASHDVNSHDWQQVKAPIIIEDYAWIATNSIILPGVTIGRAAVVGAGAVVTRNIPAYQVVAGNPARIVKERTLKQLSHSTVRFLAPIEAWVGLRG